MYTWQCPKCHTENSESGTCECGYRASKSELRYASAIAATEQRFPRGLPVLHNSTFVAHLLTGLFVLIACLLLIGLVPGAAFISVIAPTGSSTEISISKKVQASASVFSVRGHEGLLALVDVRIAERTYLLHTGPFVPTALDASGQVYSLRQNQSSTAGAALETGMPSGSKRGWVLRHSEEALVNTIFTGSEPGSWSLSEGSGKKKKTITGNLISVATPLGSGDWPALVVFGVLLIFGLLGYLTAGRASSRHLAAALPAMLLTIVGLHWTSVLVTRLLGKYVTTDGYPIAVVILLPLLVALGVAVAALLLFRYANEKLHVLARYPKITLNVWIATKVIGTLSVPVITFVLVANLDSALAVLIPGLTF